MSQPSSFGHTPEPDRRRVAHTASRRPGRFRAGGIPAGVLVRCRPRRL